MHTLARSPVREPRLNRQAPNRAFTLIELLTVIGIIAILSAITFGVIKGVNERSAINQTKAELASLAQALEAYKLQYGDYPQTGDKTQGATSTTTTITTEAQAWLFSALTGGVGPKLATYVGRSFLDLSRFSLETTTMPATAGGLVANSFLDPWGRRYLYYYRSATSPATWTNPTYFLFSAGPDGASQVSVSTAGVLTETAPTTSATAVDNIYANKN